MSDTQTQPSAIDAGMGVMSATTELLKSVARFSWAMSVYTAGQAGAMLMPSTPVEAGPHSVDEVVKAASRQLTGPVRTAYSVGTNIQAGLVDLAFDTAGFGPQGQTAPPGTTAGLAIPMLTGGSRRIAGVRTVSSGAVHRAVPQAELVETLRRYQEEAAAAPTDLSAIAVGLWKSEGFSTTVGKYLLPENTLADPRLPPAVLPIAHVGFGSGSTEELVFDPRGLKALFESRCAANYQGFSYEGIGAILRIYERGFFKVMSGALGLIRLDAPDGPDPAGFFADYLDAFPFDIQRLIAHGYGRIIAFSNMNIYKALEEITTLPPERVEAAAHGAGFAFAYMNNADLPRLLDQSAIAFDPPVRAGFQSGLIYALVFFDWYVPGLLESWQPRGSLESELIEHARAEAALGRRRGFPLAFRLEHPRA